MTEIVEGEAHEVGQELDLKRSAPATLFGTDDPRLVIKRASEQADALMDVVKKQDLSVDISGKKHLNIEAWTCLGALVGVFAVPVWTRKLLTDAGEPHGWEARVEARTRDGAIVGAAESQCTRDEKMWSWHPTNKYGKPLEPRDDFALRSMAQTRAAGKALRGALGFIATLAGFSATPAEEMPADAPDVATEVPENPGDVVLTFGKHQGLTLSQMAARSGGDSYLDWLADTSNKDPVVSQAAREYRERLQKQEKADAEPGGIPAEQIPFG